MRSELLQRIHDLLQNEDLEAIRKDVRNAIRSFRALTQDEIRSQKEVWEKEEHELDETFVYKPTEEEEKFEDLAKEFKTRENAWKAKISKEQRANLVIKQGLLQELRNIIQEEENIGKAFDSFNKVREKWDDIGDVPGNNYKEVHDEYYRLRDEFFYNINIYKQLQENDLQVNHRKKVELIEEASKLSDVADIKEREKAARDIQKQWLDVGPSPRDTYKEMSDKFFSLTRPVFAEVKTHYEKVREGFKDNKKQKDAVINELRDLLASDFEPNHKAWQKLTSKVIELQKKWKAIGFAGKEHNEDLWKQFRELADVFFEKKQIYYEKMKEEGKGAKKAKMALIEKAESLQESTNWRETTQAMLQLQKDWKKTGSCPPSDEHRLWRKFHKAQDNFFNAKKAQFAERNKTEKANLEIKRGILKKVEEFKLTKNRADDLNKLKAFSEEWRGVGFVPRKNMDELLNKFSKAMDTHYDALSADRSERSVANYSDRVERLAQGGERDLRREQSILRDKINRLNSKISSTEENMSRFTGKGAQSIIDQAEKTIKGFQREIEEIKAKLKLLREAVAEQSN
ncbi:MAG: hypothetical protein CL847_03380 [Crocinitomicaceae bacterium]|nr:hypothetical protein [Crocinitomicaceae bacterium]|tara:strand:- start:7078 stop:8787 length:1710 start_codon:yes stop_codon:yes gene_type:complete